jgi:hypothetical protein
VVGGVGVGVWPLLVVGAFDVPFDVFAFDDAGVGACASGGVESSNEPVEEREPAAVAPLRVVRGESRPGGRGFV